MLEYIVRCFGWSAFIVSICCVWYIYAIDGVCIVKYG